MIALVTMIVLVIVFIFLGGLLTIFLVSALIGALIIIVGGTGLLITVYIMTLKKEELTRSEKIDLGLKIVMITIMSLVLLPTVLYAPINSAFFGDYNLVKNTSEVYNVYVPRLDTNDKLLLALKTSFTTYRKVLEVPVKVHYAYHDGNTNTTITIKLQYKKEPSPDNLLELYRSLAKHCWSTEIWMIPHDPMGLVDPCPGYVLLPIISRTVKNTLASNPDEETILEKLETAPIIKNYYNVSVSVRGG